MSKSGTSKSSGTTGPGEKSIVEMGVSDSSTCGDGEKADVVDVDDVDDGTDGTDVDNESGDTDGDDAGGDDAGGEDGGEGDDDVVVRAGKSDIENDGDEGTVFLERFGVTGAGFVVFASE